MWLVLRVDRNSMTRWAATFKSREDAVAAITQDQIRVVTEHNHARERDGLPKQVHAQYRRDEFEFWSVHDVEQNIHDPEFDAEDTGFMWELKSITMGAWVEL